MDAHNLAIVITPNLVASGNPLRDVAICAVAGGPERSAVRGVFLYPSGESAAGDRPVRRPALHLGRASRSIHGAARGFFDRRTERACV